VRFTNFTKHLIFLILISISYQGYSQLSKTHYIPPLTSAEFGNANPENQYMYISTPNAVDVAYTIKPVGQPIAAYITGIVSNINPQEVFLANGNGQLFMPSSQTSSVSSDKGYIIEAESPIYVSVRMNAGGGAQAGALVSKGLTALGTTFRVGSYTNENAQTNYLNFVSVIATEDNTQVTFSDLPAGLIIKNYNGTTPVNITLDKGESYIIATNSADSGINRDGLIGCLVSSDKNIVVNCGSANGSFHNGQGRDYGIDQIVDLSKVGTEYILVKGNGTNDWENILIVAHSNNTSISINGNTPIATINAGDYYLIEGNQYDTNGNMYVETSAPVFTYQGIGATTSEANQGLFFVPPLSCETRGNLDNIAHIEDIGTTTYTGGITIVTKVGATVTINNTPISNFNVIGPNAVPGKPDYVTFKVTGLFGNVAIQSTDELYCAYFNYNGAASSGSFYSGFPSAPEINFDAQFATLGNCIPNITLSAANVQSFDSFEWWFDDGSGLGFVNLNINSTDLSPSLPGKYKLIGIISCTLDRLESIEVPVSICPDDIDNDGIIDNIDIDNDNDGILNCVESMGNITMDLSNTNIPRLIFQDNSSQSASATFIQNNSSGNNSNTFIGNTLGNFTSTVQPSNTAESSYNINFNELVNVKFTEDTSISHVSTNGEYFIAKVLPLNKNITLQDPDNRLLVDSNFDGVFETGIIQISGSEIHFKINPNPLGNQAYEFLANQVDGFSFIHKLANNTNASTFRGHISLTCFNLDSDEDGVDDALDLDSDNDGIPDIVESLGSNYMTLSGIDVDENGLDDAFDINAIPFDTDSDGIPDYLDLDSDNDGIYDLIETGQLGLLSDTDLNGVEDGPTYGMNGWANAAETTPDSSLIGYSILDSDGDGFFNYIDLDSDGDLCSDVVEAGFSDANGDALLGDNTVLTNRFGLVTNANDGYSLPHMNHLIAAPIAISTQPIDTAVCETSNTSISVIASVVDAFQWEISTDGINWNPIVDDALYNGALTSALNISNASLALNDYQYRVRLDRNGNSCGLYSEPIILTVNPLPIVTNTVVLTQCDDDIDGISYFNLTEANNEISTNAANETFGYFSTQAAAIAGDTNSPDYIIDPLTYFNDTSPYNAVVWARITSAFGCSVVSEMELEVSVTAIPNTFQHLLSVCDDFLDIDGNDNANNNDRDGIASFDFSAVKNLVQNIFLPQTPVVNFYRNEADALAELNKITDISNYRNIGYPNTQSIYIRVDSAIGNDCLGLGAHITLTVEPLPTAHQLSIERQCDDDQDGSYPFDVSQIESDLLNGQSLANLTISYFDQNNAALPSPLPNPFLTSSQIISIRVTNNSTSDPNGPCYDETTLEFIVDAAPIAHPVIIPAVCDDDLDDTDGLYSFDTAAIENDLLQGQTGMEVHYFDASGTEVASPLPNPFVSGSQTITARVINPINNSCFDATDLEFIVNSLPSFTIDTPQIVCSSDPTFSIVLDPIEDTALEAFDYEWKFEDGTVLSNASTLTVSTPGSYTITLTKTDGSNCSRTKSIFVDASELATITLDDISIVDISENNSITINATNNNLGLGDYEYALDNEFSLYQDDPYFNNVNPGIHTLFIRDKKGCGTTSILISIIGYPKFFTPNGDGYNEYWQIKGISAQFQANSIIYIFDRYGKLLKQLNPLSPGWDGTFNGEILPTNDYWFSVQLEDGRLFNGHFTLKR